MKGDDLVDEDHVFESFPCTVFQSYKHPYFYPLFILRCIYYGIWGC